MMVGVPSLLPPSPFPSWPVGSQGCRRLGAPLGILRVFSSRNLIFPFSSLLHSSCVASTDPGSLLFQTSCFISSSPFTWILLPLPSLGLTLYLWRQSLLGSHLPLACFRLLANTSLLRPLATLHHLPCCFLLGLCFHTTKNLC